MMKIIEYQRENNLDSSKIEEISRSDGSDEDFGHGQSYEGLLNSTSLGWAHEHSSSR